MSTNLKNRNIKKCGENDIRIEKMWSYKGFPNLIWPPNTFFMRNLEDRLQDLSF